MNGRRREMPLAHVTEINDLEELDRLGLVWKCLLAETRQASFFQSLEWLRTWWRHWGQHQRLRVFVARSAGRYLGILPLAVRTEWTRGRRVRVLAYPSNDWGAFHSPIGPQPAATLATVLSHISRTKRDWDLLDLRWVNRGSDAPRTESAMLAAGFSAHGQPWSQSAIIDLAGGRHGYWSALGSRWRDTLARGEKRLAAAGELSYVRYRPLGAAFDDRDTRWDLYDACGQIAKRSWQGESYRGITPARTPISAFLHDAHRAAVHAGGLDLNLLLLAGRPLAFAYNYHFQGRVSVLRMGCDALATTDNALSVLMRHVIDDSFERGDTEIDLGPGPLDCKRHWRPALETSYRYTHFAGFGPKLRLRWLERCLAGWLERVSLHRHGRGDGGEHTGPVAARLGVHRPPHEKSGPPAGGRKTAG